MSAVRFGGRSVRAAGWPFPRRSPELARAAMLAARHKRQAEAGRVEHLVGEGREHEQRQARLAPPPASLSWSRAHEQPAEGGPTPRRLRSGSGTSSTTPRRSGRASSGRSQWRPSRSCRGRSRGTPRTRAATIVPRTGGVPRRTARQRPPSDASEASSPSSAASIVSRPGLASSFLSYYFFPCTRPHSARDLRFGSVLLAARVPICSSSCTFRYQPDIGLRSCRRSCGALVTSPSPRSSSPPRFVGFRDGFLGCSSLRRPPCWFRSPPSWRCSSSQARSGRPLSTTAIRGGTHLVTALKFGRVRARSPRRYCCSLRRPKDRVLFLSAFVSRQHGRNELGATPIPRPDRRIRRPTSRAARAVVCRHPRLRGTVRRRSLDRSDRARTPSPASLWAAAGAFWPVLSGAARSGALRGIEWSARRRARGDLRSPPCCTTPATADASSWTRDGSRSSQPSSRESSRFAPQRCESVLEFLGLQDKTTETTQVESYAHRTVLAYIGFRIFLRPSRHGRRLAGVQPMQFAYAPLPRATPADDFPTMPAERVPSPEHPWGVQNAYIQALADLGC